MRSSYSQNNTYKSCPKYWEWSYKQRLTTNECSSALYFGSAVDDAIMANLEGEKNYMDVFESRWMSARGYGKNKPDTIIFDNPDVTYASSDFDVDILEQEDIDTMQGWVNQLRLNKLGSDPIKVFDKIKSSMRSKYKNPTATQIKYYNRCCWLGLKRKGTVLIDSFITQFKPKIKKVIATQKPAKLVTPEGDVVYGYLDFVAEIEGYDKPIIIDLKTAARPYDQSKIDLTDQLTLYYTMAGEEYKTDLVGYVVLSKKINKTEVGLCTVCGHKKTSTHKTCDNVINGKRCKGAWDIKTTIAPEVQVLVQQKTQKDKDDLLADYTAIHKGMKTGVIYRNLDKCTNWYGGLCPYYDACHKNDTSGLVSK